jgi:DNA-binding NarL/FixJ family response regulator
MPSPIVIADDHPLFRSALRRLLEEGPDVEVLAEANDGQEALELCRRFGPELVVMDVIMTGMDGIAATHAIKAEPPRISVLVMTASESMEHLAEAIRAGAAGYILKTASPQQITEAIHKVLKGESPLNQEIAMRLLMHLTNGKRERLEEVRVEQASEALTPNKERRRPLGALKRELSTREEEVLKLVVQGQSNQQIATNLLISTSTVKSHMRHISEKLGVCDRVQAAVRAVELGLLDKRDGG